MLVDIACLDISDILIKFLQIFLTREIAYRRSTRSLGYIKLEGFRLNCLIALGTGIKVCKLYRRNFVFALMTRHYQYIVNLRTLDTSSCKLSLLSNLWLVLIKILWQVDYWLFDELKVTCTTYDDTQGDWVIGLSLGLIELS